MELAALIAFVGAYQEPKPYAESLPKSMAKVEMVPIPGGKVLVDGKEVEVKPFFMAKTETTWDAFDAFLASGPRGKPYDQTKFAPDAIARPSASYILVDLGWGHKGYPAINLTSTSAEMFCRWLSQATGKKYRLPTVAEWQFAARGGVEGPWKMDAATVAKHSWNTGNAGETTQPVGKKAANGYGLHDMLGNVGEWTTDGEKFWLSGPSFMDNAAKVAPTLKIQYAPSWQESDPQMPKSRWWLSDGPFAGFRVVCEG